MPHPLFGDIQKLFEVANEQLNSERAQASAAGIGTLRGAMAGAVTDAGLLAAKCIRLDQARILGVESQSSPNDRVMFSAGFGHELYLESQFKAALTAGFQEKGFQFVREVKEERDLGELGKWMGTPDFRILLNGRSIGVEAKSLVSNFSVHKQIQANWPYMRHVLQSAHYMTVLEEDIWLIAIGNYFYAKVDGRDYVPEVRWYVMTHDAATDRFSVHNAEGETKELDFGKAHVRKYLSTIKEYVARKELAPRAKEKELGIRPYDRCTYCPLSNACNLYDSGQLDFAGWLARVKTDQKQEKNNASQREKRSGLEEKGRGSWRKK